MKRKKKIIQFYDYRYKAINTGNFDKNFWHI